MSLALHNLVRRVRHSSLLHRATPLWNFLRPAYHRLLDPFGRGVALTLGGRPVRMPVQLLATNPDWSSYEKKTFQELARWLDAQTRPSLMLDIGSSFGVVTSFALQLNPSVHVIAFDSDATSLKAMEAVVPRSAHDRMQRIRGLLSDSHQSGHDLRQAESATMAAMPAISPQQAISRSTFVCFNEETARGVPQHRLDSLLESVPDTADVLIKCDVEGAELLVLSGARKTLARLRPVLLLSVHPSHLPMFGRTTADVADFLDAVGYDWTCFDHDHEEHWLAMPRPEVHPPA